MRKRNSVSEFTQLRSEVLLRNYRESLARQSKISLQKAFQDAAEAPAPRFWVSEARAARVIAMLFKGVDLTEGMLPEKRKMYLEIFRKVKEMHAKDPGSPLGDLVFEVVNNPAPSSYLSWLRVRDILSKV